LGFWERVEDVGDALLHLSRCFVGKRDGKNRVSCNTTVDKVCDAVGNGLGFPCACACDDKERALGVENGLFLLRIKCI
jgi:hypothetical protein